MPQHSYCRPPVRQLPPWPAMSKPRCGLRFSKGTSRCWEELVSWYLQQGRALLLEGLAAKEHGALVTACKDGREAAVALLLSAYGNPGCAEVLAALAAVNHAVLRAAHESSNAATIESVLAAYGSPSSAAALAARRVTISLACQRRARAAVPAM